MSFLRSVALRLPPVRRLHDSRTALLIERDRLVARLASGGVSPFFHYHARFDPEEVVRRHAVAGLRPDSLRLTNFLGVRIDPKFFPTILDGKAGTVEPVPIPANWHADVAEWGAALRAVDLARERFTVVELGCGWGCWLNNTGVAARRAGLKVRLVGIEGDEGHIGFAEEACATNGFTAAEVHLHRGIAAATEGTALFPRQAQAGVAWGLEPIFGASETERAAAARAGTHDEVPMIALGTIAAEHGRIDLLHVDIQGGEADLVAGCRAVLHEYVAYLVVGTHSRQIEGRLFELLLDDGWVLEIERPAILDVGGAGPVVTVDGVQGWRNPRLLPL